MGDEAPPPPTLRNSADNLRDMPCPESHATTLSSVATNTVSRGSSNRPSEDKVSFCSVRSIDARIIADEAGDRLKVVVNKLQFEGFLCGETAQALTWAAYEIPFEDVRWGRLIGRGAFSRVYVCEHLSTEVAIKALEEEEAVNLSRMRREIGLLLRLRHPNIVLMMGAITKEPSCGVCVVMELCHGGTVCQRIYRARVLPLQEAYRISVQLSLAVEYIHNANCKHRDIAASNVFLQTASYTDLVAKLGDFGWGKFGSPATPDALTPGITPGTAGRIAPEVFERKYGFAADVFAVGIYIYECVSMQMPHTTEAIMSTCQRLRGVSGEQLRTGMTREEGRAALCWMAQHGTTPDATDADARLPGVGELLRKCWTLDPAERTDATGLVRMLRALMMIPTDVEGPAAPDDDSD